MFSKTKNLERKFSVTGLDKRVTCRKWMWVEYVNQVQRSHVESAEVESIERVVRSPDRQITLGRKTDC